VKVGNIPKREDIGRNQSIDNILKINIILLWYTVGASKALFEKRRPASTAYPILCIVFTNMEINNFENETMPQTLQPGFCLQNGRGAVCSPPAAAVYATREERLKS